MLRCPGHVAPPSSVLAVRFNNTAYGRGVPHRKGLTSRTCDRLCQRRPACWGTNFIEGINGQYACTHLVVFFISSRAGGYIS